MLRGLLGAAVGGYGALGNGNLIASIGLEPTFSFLLSVIPLAPTEVTVNVVAVVAAVVTVALDGVPFKGGCGSFCTVISGSSKTALQFWHTFLSGPYLISMFSESGLSHMRQSCTPWKAASILLSMAAFPQLISRQRSVTLLRHFRQ